MDVSPVALCCGTQCNSIESFQETSKNVSDRVTLGNNMLSALSVTEKLAYHRQIWRNV